jgi:zinc protease
VAENEAVPESISGPALPSRRRNRGASAGTFDRLAGAVGIVYPVSGHPRVTRTATAMLKRALLLLALSAAPAAAQDVGIPYRSFDLPNGLRLLVHEDHTVPMAAVDVWYHVGSGYEQPGRTGFAHLFEHLMFEGSRNVPEGAFDNLLESAGAVNNGSTTSDRTNYYEVMPSNAVPLALWLEADRMGGLLATMTQEKLDLQRDVVKNERRQSYENRPYGMFYPTASKALYPEGHPYSWPTIGSMTDLSAATKEDVEAFFRQYYVPNNAVLVVAGDVHPDSVYALVRRYFGSIPRGSAVTKPDIPVPAIPQTRYLTLEDRVSLPQVNLIWRTGKAYSPDDAPLSALAAILTDGKNSRLYRRMVYTEQVAQSVGAFNDSELLSGDFYLRITGKEDLDLNRLQREALEEIAKIAASPPTAEELQRVKSGIETQLVGGLETVLGKAEQLNQYLYYTGDPDHVQEVLESYRSLTPADVQRVARQYLEGKNRIVISIVPTGRTELAAKEAR